MKKNHQPTKTMFRPAEEMLNPRGEVMRTRYQDHWTRRRLTSFFGLVLKIKCTVSIVKLVCMKEKCQHNIIIETLMATCRKLFMSGNSGHTPEPRWVAIAQETSRWSLIQLIAFWSHFDCGTFILQVEAICFHVCALNSSACESVPAKMPLKISLK